MLGEAFEEMFGLLPTGIDEDVEATAVGHADDDVADAEARRTADQALQRNEHGFATLDGETLSTDKSLMQEALKLFGLNDGAEEAATGGVVIGRTETAGFDAFL